METKNIVATLYLKDGNAVKSMDDFTIIGDVFEICQVYNDSGIDKIMIFDLSTDDDEHENTRPKRHLHGNCKDRSEPVCGREIL